MCCHFFIMSILFLRGCKSYKIGKTFKGDWFYQSKILSEEHENIPKHLPLLRTLGFGLRMVTTRQAGLVSLNWTH